MRAHHEAVVLTALFLMTGGLSDLFRGGGLVLRRTLRQANRRQAEAAQRLRRSEPRDVQVARIQMPRRQRLVHKNSGGPPQMMQRLRRLPIAGGGHQERAAACICPPEHDVGVTPINRRPISRPLISTLARLKCRAKRRRTQKKMNRVPDSQLLTLTLIEEERRSGTSARQEREREASGKNAFEIEKRIFWRASPPPPSFPVTALSLANHPLFREKVSKANVIELERSERGEAREEDGIKTERRLDPCPTHIDGPVDA